MSRLIDISDLHNKVMLNKSDWGIFATQIDNLIEGVVSQVPTTSGFTKKQVIKMLEELQKEAERGKEFYQGLEEEERKKNNKIAEAYYAGQVKVYGTTAVEIMRRIETLKTD